MRRRDAMDFFVTLETKRQRKHREKVQARRKAARASPASPANKPRSPLYRLMDATSRLLRHSRPGRHNRPLASPAKDGDDGRQQELSSTVTPRGPPSLEAAPTLVEPFFGGPPSQQMAPLDLTPRRPDGNCRAARPQHRALVPVHERHNVKAERSVVPDAKRSRAPVHKNAFVGLPLSEPLYLTSTSQVVPVRPRRYISAE